MFLREEKMKKYLLGAFLIIAMNLSAAKLSEIKGLENLRNYNEIKDSQVEKILNYDDTINKDKKIYSVKDNNLFTGAVIKRENNDVTEITFFKDGINEGVSYNYYLNGNLEREQVFENNSLISEKFYDQNGKIIKEYQFNKLRNGILKKYYKDTEK